MGPLANLEKKEKEEYDRNEMTKKKKKKNKQEMEDESEQEGISDAEGIDRGTEYDIDERNEDKTNNETRVVKGKQGPSVETRKNKKLNISDTAEKTVNKGDGGDEGIDKGTEDDIDERNEERTESRVTKRKQGAAIEVRKNKKLNRSDSEDDIVETRKNKKLNISDPAEKTVNKGDGRDEGIDKGVEDDIDERNEERTESRVTKRKQGAAIEVRKNKKLNVSDSAEKTVNKGEGRDDYVEKQMFHAKQVNWVKSHRTIF